MKRLFQFQCLPFVSHVMERAERHLFYSIQFHLLLELVCTIHIQNRWIILLIAMMEADILSQSRSINEYQRRCIFNREGNYNFSFSTLPFPTACFAFITNNSMQSLHCRVKVGIDCAVSSELGCVGWVLVLEDHSTLHPYVVE